MFESVSFDPEVVASLDAVAASEALATSRVAVMAAEAQQLFLAAHWADLHAPEYVEASRAALPGDVPGGERVKRVGADGCPEMAEFASAELAALLGRSPVAGENFIADAVNLRHRHPLLWAGIAAGRVRVWLAVKAARRCAAVELDWRQARWVDEQVAPYVTSLTPGRFLALVEAKIREVDPAGAEARAEAAALARFVRTGQTDEAGLKTLVARAEAGDVVVFVAMLDRIAGILAERGDTDSVEGRRASALRVMADPAQALALLASAALSVLPAEAGTGDDVAAADDEPAGSREGPGARVERWGGPSGSPCPWDPEDGGVPGWWLPDDESTRGAAEAERWERERTAAANGERSDGRWAGRPEESVEWMLDAAGDRLPPHTLRRDLVPAAAPGPEDTETDTVVESPPPEMPAQGVESTVLGVGDRALLRSLITQLKAAQARLRPVCVFHVHTTRAALQSGEGVARVEELGPRVLGELRTWLTAAPGVGRGQPRGPWGAQFHTHADHARSRREAERAGGARGGDGVTSPMSIRLLPVLDPDQIPAVDRYEIPAPMRRAVEVLQPHDVFPFATQASRTCDKDHVVRHRPGRRGQTRLENLAPLGRHAHRLKTHGRWRVHSPEPGTYWWRSPHGHWFDVGPEGTTYRGRDPDRDRNLPAEE
jgi:hypothetical protein